tara:strand:+ start:140 stop:769 length:630 start_codon:yes stop_codon:yes gene_type:complete
MGRRKGGGTIFHAMAEKLQKQEADKYLKAKTASDSARETVKAGLDDRVSFQPINLDEFSKEKREQARSRRSERRAKREEKMKAREERFDKRLEERRRQNEMRKPQQEIGGEIGVLGAPNPYGDDAIWDNNTRSWAPNPKKDTVNEWDKYRDKSQSKAPEGETNLFGQGRATGLGPSAKGTFKEGVEDNTSDFKKLYEELLKIKGGKITS